MWKHYLGVPLIYIPLITTVPFVVLGVLLIKTHLKYVGGMNIRGYWSFVPSWISHRYQYKNQITYRTGATWIEPESYRWFWIFNCKLYCPMSVALFRYTAYLVKIVENWWCPFFHDKKHEYSDASIDQSYWHINDFEKNNLAEDDRDNEIWNDETRKSG